MNDMTFNVTLLDNKYGDNIRSKTITWDELMQRVKDPPLSRVKGRDGIIGGQCTWEDGVAMRNVNKLEYVYDGDGEPITDENIAMVTNLSNGECLFRDLDGRVQRLSVTIPYKNLLNAFETNPEKRDELFKELKGRELKGGQAGKRR